MAAHSAGNRRACRGDSAGPATAHAHACGCHQLAGPQTADYPDAALLLWKEVASVGFSRKKVDDLLVACKRCCCICHRFCCTKIETDHIVLSADRGPDDIENAIPVCFECHAEIHAYNDAHPRGRKFTPNELRKHKEQWLKTCREHPDILIAAHRDRDVGPLQALLDELDFNRSVAVHSINGKHGALFLMTQFERAVQEGMVAILEDNLRTAILDAYVVMTRANQATLAELPQGEGSVLFRFHETRTTEALQEAAPLIDAAYNSLIHFLGHNERTADSPPAGGKARERA